MTIEVQPVSSATKDAMIRKLGSEKAYRKHMANVGRLGADAFPQKLTDEQRSEIVNSTESSLKIAPKYGVSASLVRHIRNRYREEVGWINQLES